MNCPNCNQELPDTAKACPACGMSFIMNRGVQNPTVSVEAIAAEKELEKLKKDDIKGAIIIGIVASVFCVIIAILAKSVFGTILFIFTTCLAIWGLTKHNKRLEELNNIKNGKTRISLCPKCKSTNIEMNMVQTDSTTYLGRTTISDNINPLRPFTHTNVNQGSIETANTYKNKCHCLNCGYVFDKPETFYQ